MFFNFNLDSRFERHLIAVLADGYPLNVPAYHLLIVLLNFLSKSGKKVGQLLNSELFPLLHDLPGQCLLLPLPELINGIGDIIIGLF